MTTTSADLDAAWLRSMSPEELVAALMRNELIRQVAGSILDEHTGVVLNVIIYNDAC